MTSKLPLWQTIREAYCTTWSHAGAVLRTWPLWLLAGAVAWACAWFLIWPVRDATVALIAAMQLGALLQVPFFAIVAVAWHRLILLGEPMTVRLGGARPNEFAAFARWAVAFQMVYFVPYSAIVATMMERAAVGAEVPTGDTLALIALSLIAVYLVTRLSLLLPARALGHRAVGVGDVWRVTRGNFWRLFAGSLVALLPSYMVSALLSSEAETRLHYAWVSAAAMSTLVVSGIVEITFLSLAYRHWFGHLLASTEPRPE